jgi:hypothetical protein
MKSSMMTLAALMLAVSVGAEVIDSGSTGTDLVFHAGLGRAFSDVPPGTVFACTGPPLSPDTCIVTVPLREPPNHVFNFTAMTVDSSVEVRFRRNAANTPVFLLVKGDVVINGLVSVNGEQGGSTGSIAAQGGPGGFSGGLSAGGVGLAASVGGAGSGPGGALGSSDREIGGDGVFVSNSDTVPLIGGSGGGSGHLLNGGGGAGAILIAAGGTIDLSTTATPNTKLAVTALGGFGKGGVGGGGFGSNGAIRLVATLIKGNTRVRAANGSSRDGAVRVDTPPGGMQWVGSSEPPATFNPPGQPIAIFPPIMPALRIVSIGGVALPAQPTADAATPDLALPTDFVNPVSVIVEATHVPDGTLVKVIASPQFGAGDRVISAPTALTGPSPCSADPTSQCMQATVAVTLPPTGVGIISALIDSVVAVP